jgi:anti-anti-sigma regulatory factor
LDTGEGAALTPRDEPPSANGAGSARGTIDVIVSGPISPAETRRLCDRIHATLERSGATVVVCDVGAVVAADAAVVDVIARLQLTARRLGCEVRVRHAHPRLRELLRLMGLSGVVPLCSPSSGVDGGREVEQGEQPRRVEKETDPGDATG